MLVGLWLVEESGRANARCRVRESGPGTRSCGGTAESGFVQF